jgi:hypothetical protein
MTARISGRLVRRSRLSLRRIAAEPKMPLTLALTLVVCRDASNS